MDTATARSRDRIMGSEELKERALQQEEQSNKILIEVYVCPTPGCNDYYGSSNMPDLPNKLTGVQTEDRHNIPAKDSRVGVLGMRHNRAECPSCRLKGTYVERALVRTVVTRPASDA